MSFDMICASSSRIDSSSSMMRRRWRVVVAGFDTLGAIVAPLHVVSTRVAIEHARKNEKQVGKPIEILPCGRADGLRAAQGDQASLRAPADRARHVGRGGSGAAAGQDEFLERRQSAVPRFQPLLEPRYAFVGQERMAGNADFPAQVEQVLLDRLKRFRRLLWQGCGPEHADGRIQLVDVSERRDARVVLRYAPAVAQAGFAGIPGSGCDFREAMAHARFYPPSFAFWTAVTSLSIVPRASVVRKAVPLRACAASRKTLPSASYVML